MALLPVLSQGPFAAERSLSLMISDGRRSMLPLELVLLSANVSRGIHGDLEANCCQRRAGQLIASKLRCAERYLTAMRVEDESCWLYSLAFSRVAQLVLCMSAPARLR